MTFAGSMLQQPSFNAYKSKLSCIRIYEHRSMAVRHPTADCTKRSRLPNIKAASFVSYTGPGETVASDLIVMGTHARHGFLRIGRDMRKCWPIRPCQSFSFEAPCMYHKRQNTDCRTARPWHEPVISPSRAGSLRRSQLHWGVGRRGIDATKRVMTAAYCPPLRFVFGLDID